MIKPRLHPSLSDQLLSVGNDHAVQLCFCDALEEIADGLPHFNYALVQRTLDLLASGALEDIRLQQQSLFDELGRTERANAVVRLVSSRLTAQPAYDACALAELTDVLRSLARQGHVSNPEMLGYLLRGFFDACRRHVAWQVEVFVPLAREHVCSDYSLSHGKWTHTGGYGAAAART